MLKFITIVLILLIIGSIFSPYLSQVFGGFGTAFNTITSNSYNVINFFVGLFNYVFNKPYLMILISCFLVFAVINVVINFFKGDK